MNKIVRHHRKYFSLFLIEKKWLNCDRFVNSKVAKVKFKLKIKNNDDTDVKLVFKKLHAVMPSSNYENSYFFGEIHKDEEVVLVVIKIKDNQYQIANKVVRIGKLDELSLDFQSTTLEEMRSTIKMLSPQF